MEQRTEKMIVAVRIRPLSKAESELGQRSCCTSLGSVVAIRKEGNGGYLKSEQASINEYMFDTVFDAEASQVDVYERTAKVFIPNLLLGLNVTVFCYGATGAGKTHTMLGNTRCDAATTHGDAGIIPNAVFDLFSQINEKKKGARSGEEWCLRVSFMEVYNEQVFDLLEPSGRMLAVREDQEKGIVVVAGITEQAVDSYDAAMHTLTTGNKNRRTEATLANNVSSRSHAIFQIVIRHTYRSESGSVKESVVESKLSLIDLAGSERASATNNRGVRLQEGANINKSLLALANCINALSASSGANAKKIAVKYRDSKLTHLLKSSLEGNCNLVMIANVNPSHITYEDSHNTLKYANRAKTIKLNPLLKEANVESSWVEREARLIEENNSLRRRVYELESEVASLREILESSNSAEEVDTALADRLDRGSRPSFVRAVRGSVESVRDVELSSYNDDPDYRTNDIFDLSTIEGIDQATETIGDILVMQSGQTENKQVGVVKVIEPLLSDSILEAALFDSDESLRHLDKSVVVENCDIARPAIAVEAASVNQNPQLSSSTMECDGPTSCLYVSEDDNTTARAAKKRRQSAIPVAARATNKKTSSSRSDSVAPAHSTMSANISGFLTSSSPSLVSDEPVPKTKTSAPPVAVDVEPRRTRRSMFVTRSLPAILEPDNKKATEEPAKSSSAKVAWAEKPKPSPTIPITLDPLPSVFPENCPSGLEYDAKAIAGASRSSRRKSMAAISALLDAIPLSADSSASFAASAAGGIADAENIPPPQLRPESSPAFKTFLVKRGAPFLETISESIPSDAASAQPLKRSKRDGGLALREISPATSLNVQNVINDNTTDGQAVVKQSQVGAVGAFQYNTRNRRKTMMVTRSEMNKPPSANFQKMVQGDAKICAPSDILSAGQLF